jgi:hypothetical protein
MSLRLACSALALVSFVACGSGSSQQGGGGQTSSTTSATSSTGSTSSSSTTTSATGPTCGTLTCAGGEVCVVDETDPTCSALPDGQTCPTGTTQSQCGGIGYACCCGPNPPDHYRCVSAVSCGGAPTCDCFEAGCASGQMCFAFSPNGTEFHCVTPPAP